MKNSLHYLLIIIVCALLFFSCSSETEEPNTVQTEAGLISGIKNEEGDIRIFKGIPFAAPPVGDLRWKTPQPVEPWEGVRKCEAFGPSPMQNSPEAFSMWTEEFLIPAAPIAEDCLYLNVWTGAKSAEEKRPVLVWIYGGGFTSGGSGVPIYDGEAMAQKDIVFVSINYRVGIFGFFAHPELTQESGHQASGNYGLMDQIAALKWVQDNIVAFGGDPNNVTIAGQSAGSMSVNCLVASPLAKGLFQKAIAHSGASFTRGNASLQQAEENGQQIAEALDASSVSVLRSIPADTLMKVAQGMRGPIIDGYVLPEHIADIFAERKQNEVALLTGWNEDEGLLFGPIKSAAEFRQQAEQQYGEDSGTFLQYYPAANDSVAEQSQLDFSRDMIFGVQNYAWANIQSKQDNSPVYVYRFTRKVPATGEYKKYGAFHTGEVPYAYNNLKFVDRPWEEIDHQMADTMSSYWANFIKKGNPNGTGLAYWPIYDIQNKEIMMLGKQAEVQTLADGASLDFLYAQMLEK